VESASTQQHDRRKWHTLGAVSLGMFMMMLDVTVVNVALPSINRSLGISLSDLEWVVNGYVLALAVALLTGGRLADLIGRRLIFITGLIIFTAASLAAGLSEGSTLLIAARFAQGAGAALVSASSLSIISAAFPPHERGTAIGIWSAVVGTAIAIGPLVGGLLAQGIGWSWIFFVNVPIGIVAVIAARMFIDESKDGSAEQRLDAGGLIASAVSLGSLTYALIEGNTYGWGSTRIVGLLAVSAVALAVFLAIELRSRVPMLDLSLFRSRTFSGAIATAGIMGFAMTGVFFFLSLFMQDIAGFSAIGAGAAFLPMTMLMMVIPAIAGKLSDKHGPRWLIVGGLGLFAAGLVVFSTAGVGDGFWHLLPAMLLTGAGISFLFGPVTAAAMSGVPIFKAGVASGVLNAMRQSGSSLGLAVMGAIVAAHSQDIIGSGAAYKADFVAGFQPAMLVAAGVALLGAAVAAITIRNPTGSPFGAPVTAPQPSGGPAREPSLNGAQPRPVPVGEER
jgi:EmrB/QacA subfamily drug resistance transporter